MSVSSSGEAGVSEWGYKLISVISYLHSEFLGVVCVGLAAPEDRSTEDANGDGQAGGLRPDQLARLGAESDNDMGGDEAGADVAGGAGVVLDRADHDHVGGVSQTGAIAGNFAAASALRARLTGEQVPPNSFSVFPSNL